MNNMQTESKEAVLKISRIFRELLPTIIGDNAPECEYYDDETILEYDVLGAPTIDEVVITMTINADMCLVYWSKDKTTGKYHVCLVYRPEGCYMYKVNFITDESEIVRTVTVTIYDSITDFIHSVDSDLVEHLRGDFDIREQISQENYEEIFSA